MSRFKKQDGKSCKFFSNIVNINQVLNSRTPDYICISLLPRFDLYKNGNEKFNTIKNPEIYRNETKMYTVKTQNLSLTQNRLNKILTQ